jgi:hypothetical protein
MLAKVRTKPIWREQGMNLIELLTIIALISCGGLPSEAPLIFS